MRAFTDEYTCMSTHPPTHADTHPRTRTHLYTLTHVHTCTHAHVHTLQVAAYARHTTLVKKKKENEDTEPEYRLVEVVKEALGVFAERFERDRAQLQVFQSCFDRSYCPNLVCLSRKIML